MLTLENTPKTSFSTAVVIPCFKVTAHILSVIASVPGFIDKIYIVDDACPEHSGDYVRQNASDSRIEIIIHAENQGVGGAMVSGYKKALADGYDIIAKLDGDGQMDGGLLPEFIAPIMQGQADYSKGNRFYRVESLQDMPTGRVIGNAILSFVTKLSSGYWHVFDPTNGYTAISAQALKLLPLDKISRRYFFESDMLFRLNTVRALVFDVPMHAVYNDEKSNLNVATNIYPFAKGHIVNFGKRIFYNYFLRNFSLASMELVLGLAFLIFGVIFGTYRWTNSVISGEINSTGTVMIAVLPIILGFQLLIAFLGYDVASEPKRAISSFVKKP